MALKRCNGSRGAASVPMVAVVFLALLATTRPGIARQDSSTKDDDCLRNPKQVALATLMYAQDYDERMPPMLTATGVAEVLNPYVKNSYLFRCPVTGASYQPNPALNCVLLARVKDPTRTVMFRDWVPHHEDSGKPCWNAAYVDGHAQTVYQEPAVGPPAPTPPPPDRAMILRQQLAVLYSQRRELDRRIRALELELKRVTKPPATRHAQKSGRQQRSR